MQIGRPHKLAAGMIRCALCVLSMTGLSLIGLSFLAGPAMAKTVFLVCDGEFITSTAINGPIETDQFDGALYLSVEADDFAVRRVKLLPFERSTRLAAIDLMPHPRSTDDGRVTVFTSTEDELVIEQTEARGKMVNALVGDDPLALTPESLHVMNLRLNRFLAISRFHGRIIRCVRSSQRAPCVASKNATAIQKPSRLIAIR